MIPLGKASHLELRRQMFSHMLQLPIMNRAHINCVIEKYAALYKLPSSLVRQDANGKDDQADHLHQSGYYYQPKSGAC